MNTANTNPDIPYEQMHIIQSGEECGKDTLTTPADSVPSITPELLKVAMAMSITLANTNGFGLAAPQVGLSKRLIVVKQNQVYVAMFNPVIIIYSEREDISREGCLSIGNGVEYYNVHRRRSVVVSYMDIYGKPAEMKGAKRLAYCIQHEVDHLDGILISMKGVPV